MPPTSISWFNSLSMLRYSANDKAASESSSEVDFLHFFLDPLGGESESSDGLFDLLSIGLHFFLTSPLSSSAL